MLELIEFAAFNTFPLPLVGRAGVGVGWCLKAKKTRPMRALTIGLPDDQHKRLKTLASQRGLSLNRLFEEFSIKALAKFDTENRFHIRAARGRNKKASAILDKLDRAHGR
jgi:hypothetical protein